MGKKHQKKKKNQDQKHNQKCNSGSNNSNSDALKSTEISIVEENRDDLISSLSDDILWHIISFLPFESAQQISFVSTRWRGLCFKTLVQHGSVEDIARAIDGFLTHFDELNPLRHPWRLQFHFSHGSILLATIVANKKLHLDFFSTGKQEFLSQFDWHLKLNRQTLNHQLSSSTFFVKTLHLTSLSFLTSDTVCSMVSNFQFLESLNIKKCYGLQSLTIIDAYQKLRCFTVLDCPQLLNLHIKAFKLRYFWFRGPLPWFWLEHVLSLKDVMLDFREGPRYAGFNYFNVFDSFFPTIEYVKILTLCKWTFEALISPFLTSGFLPPRFNKLKELQWIDSSIEEKKIDSLLSFLKFCPLLERLFIKIDPAYYCCLPSTGKCANQVATYTRSHHLKVVVLEGFMNQDDEILVAMHLQQVVNKKTLIIARSDGNCARRLVKIFSHQPKQRTMGKVVAPQRKKCSYKFVEEVEDISQFCFKHAYH